MPAPTATPAGADLARSSDMRRDPSDELALYLLIAVVGAIPVVITLWRHAVFTAEPTIGLLMMALAIAGLAILVRRQRDH